MRPPRVVILVFVLATSFFLIGRAITSSARSISSYAATTTTTATATTTTSTNALARLKASQSIWGFMYYNTPFSLFPPNAAISLTDDNSTSFAARPAAFGPKLAAKGLSGQLWVGSGFAEDTVDGEGELGCSDLPNWDGVNPKSLLRNSLNNGAAAPKVTSPNSRLSRLRRSSDPEISGRERSDAEQPDKALLPNSNDGTDDYLNESAGESSVRGDTASSLSHADIQSMQEAAEIQGKVVLLMRGGCGFLEKVMWAQRRGAVAVIVGDNQKGGPLIQMFAQGDDVDNVTIPSVFTARTTAQLLSSLTQPGGFSREAMGNDGNSLPKAHQALTTKHEGDDALSKTPGGIYRTSIVSSMAKRGHDSTRATPSQRLDWSSWLSLLRGWVDIARQVDGNSRPPSSGRLRWVSADNVNDQTSKGKTHENPVLDSFVIGVQDWRDSDLVDKPASGRRPDSLEDPAGATGSHNAITTPGSGEYNPNRMCNELRDARVGGNSATFPSRGLLAKLFGHEAGRSEPSHNLRKRGDDQPTTPKKPDTDHHEGLWVTITPTNSASPFFDTLLVLVISPLVTLTVVYALLILRARIRRRRWRAPKSVVEQLPVRTYHTVAASPTDSPRLPSPSSASPTTPLLQQSPPQSRPRSRTTTGIPESENFRTSSSAMPTPQSAPRSGQRNEHEKGAGGFSAEWRKYMGRQVECVVCLEEYVDGVSRVMSLPCGHEFHEDCITPWLTTRRRTCPICKGDVVRSLARGSPFSDMYRDDSDDEPEAESSRSRSADHQTDLEQGLPSSSHETDDPASHNRPDGWTSLWPSAFGTFSRHRSPPPEDRDR